MILTKDDYRRYTGDNGTSDDDLDLAIQDAQEQAEFVTNRIFDHGTYTETLQLYGGVVYPAAYPVSTTDGTIVNAGVLVGSEYYPEEGSWSHSILGPGDFTTLTYTGGWTPETAPVSLKKILARIVRATVVKPVVDLSTVPAGVSSLSLGDQSISFSGGVSANIDPTASIMAELAGWRRPEL